MESTYKVLRNSGEAYRQFHSAGLLAGAHEFAIQLLRRRLTGGIIAVMGVAGLAGSVITFWLR
jgi:hypothetical protein